MIPPISLYYGDEDKLVRRRTKEAVLMGDWAQTIAADLQLEILEQAPRCSGKILRAYLKMRQIARQIRGTQNDEKVADLVKSVFSQVLESSGACWIPVDGRLQIADM